jgi:hypothetical protein
MPDWITHIAVAWTICRILRFKFDEFNSANTMLVITGALIPDLVKVVLGLKLIGVDAYDYLAAVHLPSGSIVLAGIISLVFPEKKKTFLFLGLGVLTHYSLDLILEHVSGGIYLFFPFNWWQWQLEFTNSSDYMITFLALCIAGLVYLIGKEVDKRSAESVHN